MRRKILRIAAFGLVACRLGGVVIQWRRIDVPLVLRGDALRSVVHPATIARPSRRVAWISSVIHTSRLWKRGVLPQARRSHIAAGRNKYVACALPRVRVG